MTQPAHDDKFANRKKPWQPHNDTPEPMTVEQIVVSFLPCDDCGERGCPYKWGDDRKALAEDINSLIEQEKRAARKDELEKIARTDIWVDDPKQLKVIANSYISDRIAQLKKGTQ